MEITNENDNESEISFKSDHKNRENLSLPQKLFRSVSNSFSQNAFLSHYFSCCMNPKKEEAEISDLEEWHEGGNYMNNEEVDGVMSLFPSKYLRKDERKIIKFDQNNIIGYFNSLCKNKHFERKFEKFNKFGLRMFMCENNKFSSTIPITRCQIEIPKSLFTARVPSVEQVGMAIIDPNSRMEWDDNYKEYKILANINGNTEIVKILTKKQMRMIIPREIYDKRTHFMENGIFYSFSSSLPDSLRPPKKEPIRAMDFFGIFTVSEDDKNNILIDGFHQIDIKIGQPGPLIFMSLPLKMTQFTEKLIRFLNR